MADKGKKAKSGAAKAEEKASSAKSPAAEGKSDKASSMGETPKPPPQARAAEHDEHEHGDGHDHADHGHDDHGHGAKAHDHAPNYREYFMVFMVLAVLTILEVAVTKVPGINRKLMGLALVGMALTKASFVGLYYMHLKHETKVLKMTVALPMAAPTIYALVLISEAAWRLTR